MRSALRRSSSSAGVVADASFTRTPKVVEDPAGDGHADVGPDEGLLELVPHLVVDGAAAPEVAEVAGQQGPGLAEPVPQPGADRQLLDAPAPCGGTSTSGRNYEVVAGGGRSRRRRLGCR